MVRLSLLLGAVALLATAAHASEITGVAKLQHHDCKTKCHASYRACSNGCKEEITPDMQFFTVCQTECERTRQYCTAGC